MTQTEVGLGVSQAPLAIYIANRPVNDHYPVLNTRQPLGVGELAYIVANNSNHWRKVFNVYAKILWQIEWPKITQNNALSWQEYRDKHLLQPHSHESLLFSAPQFTTATGPQIKIIAGKTYAAALKLPPLTWVDAHFAVNEEARLVVSPYLDYRQLSNERIEILAKIVNSFDRGLKI